MYELKELLDMANVPINVEDINLVEQKLEQMYHDSIFKHDI